MTKLIKFKLSHKKWLRHYQQIGFVWAIFIVSALPFFLMLSATRPELQNQEKQGSDPFLIKHIYTHYDFLLCSLLLFLTWDEMILCVQL